MDVFSLRQRLVDDYREYTRSFIKIADRRIAAKVDHELDAGAFWPEPLIQLNPTFEPGGTVDDLVADGTLQPECSRIFRIDKTDSDSEGKKIILHKHQTEAIHRAKAGKSYVLTSGTGSGKSLAYIVPIVDHVLRRGSGNGIQAIVVYPMNALANSQAEELSKFLERGYPGGKSPVTFARYTGQEKGPERDEIRSNPPDILLTNYMMLELLLTRGSDRDIVKAAQGLRFLVLDELHTYRGRQGADVALLVRRCRLAFSSDDMICVGTSATMASGGSSAEEKVAVAEVAKTLFGAPVGPDQVVGETLRRATPELDFGEEANIARLKAAIAAGPTPPGDYESFRVHPVASWIESVFGVRSEVGTGRLVRQTPRSLRGIGGAAEELGQLTSTDPEACAELLQSFLTMGSQLKEGQSSRFPIFAFRLHQFFTRGDTVWSTIEAEDKRYLNLAKLVSKPGEEGKPLFPLVFCRQCGAAYYRVTVRSDLEGRRLVPRDEHIAEGEDEGGEAYLYLSEAAPWPRTTGLELLDRLPSFMKDTNAKGEERVRPDESRNLPESVFVASDGRLVAEGGGLPATLIPGLFLFCLDPDCGIAYTKTQRSERQKLATLGVDNRSTATTILAVRSLIELQGDSSLRPEARKLLSFTDNRQDASLQAGHFNDFTQVALLRSALYKAVSSADSRGLGHADLSRCVFGELSLKFDDYAADREVKGPARVATQDALRRVIDYHIYRDLQRGWRVTAPNLEDCGLLHYEYDGLTGSDGLLEETALWSDGFKTRGAQGSEEFVETPAPLRYCSKEIREEVIRTLLELLRRSLAVKVDVLDPQKQLDLVEQTKPRLLEGTVWYLEDPRELVKAVVAYPRPRQRGDGNGLAVSSYGRYGQYLRRQLRGYVPQGSRFGRDEVDAAIQFLFKALKRYGIVEQVRDGEVPGYQINADALRWIAWTGEVRPVDRTRLLEVGQTPPSVNRYFVDCYRGFVDLKCLLEAREHTAQVASEDRQEREKRFRSGDLPLLFCSPTMELGVDIAQLNLVNLRNVPPTPANYAQRSGRAGRGGQPALVYTYCAGRSPHDQYYFREPSHMVAGSVAPPRIDLRNKDLVRSHIHAIWMEIVKPELGNTLTSVLDLNPDDGRMPLPIKDHLRDALSDQGHRNSAIAQAKKLMAGIQAELASASWYHDNWANDVLSQLELSFDRACDRWRELYRSAVRQREIHHKIIGDHTRPESDRDHSRRLRAQAESQIRLLTEAEGAFEGDFYSYRYFAAEGFLPGYNFPRLPLSAYVPGKTRRRGRDEFVSRPRFLAISEFGPRALIYHEGSRYRVYKVNLDYDSESVEATHTLTTVTMKRCPTCGYGHIEAGSSLSEVCERCGSALGGDSVIHDLVRQQNVSLRLAQRITCDEEERQRYGYKLLTAYRFPLLNGRPDRKDATVCVGDLPVMRLHYGDAAELYRINLGWARQKDNQPPGFVLDLEKGYWARNQSDAQDQDDATIEGRSMRVVPYVSDTKNALVMSFEPGYSIGEMAGLQAAFKEAIQKRFQIEPRELACEAMPTRDERCEVLFYEASEGGAGVLRQLVEDPSVMPELARTALEICHFNPDTLEDKGLVTCGKACYRCLLDYGNQPDHQFLDRHLIRDLLAELARAQCRPAGGTGVRGERIAELCRQCDSQLEIKWLEFIDSLMLTPPSHAQYLIEACSTRPDFYYEEHGVAVFIDGPPHDDPEQIREDEAITRRLQEAGYGVIRFHHKADWGEMLRSRPDVFGVAKT